MKLDLSGDEVIKGFIAEEIKLAHIHYAKTQDIYKKHQLFFEVGGAYEETRNFYSNQANQEVERYYEKIVGCFLNSIKILYRISQQQRPEWLDPDLWPDVALTLKTSVSEHMGCND
jgi:hypothetical protein